uniref:NADH-ubiquinone oxidoreductase chain 4L n=1 Tax=Curculionidae sp. 4 AH-2016 TaxID=1903830 RepID=A0A343C2R5_9CUCU|nr:NADH dehydrogenase subunit 4L [Curculionidae sp. 4 AH-2016]
MVLFFSGMLIYVLKYKHFLLMLLSLELTILSLYMLLMMYLSFYIYEYFVSMFFLTMSVCEGALGLSLLVLIVRTHGSDAILMFDNLW